VKGMYAYCMMDGFVWYSIVYYTLPLRVCRLYRYSRAVVDTVLAI